MKTISSLILTLAILPAFAQAGTALEIVETETVVVLDMPTAPKETHWWAEAGASYGFAESQIIKNDLGQTGMVDSYGGDLTLGCNLSPNHALNARIAYGYGSHSQLNPLMSDWLKLTTKVHTFQLTLGYRYTHHFNSDWSGFVGVNVGVGNESVKLRAHDALGRAHIHGSDYGFAYSAEIGAKYHFCSDMYAFMAYQFQGNTCSPDISGAGLKLSTRKQTYHSVRVGIGFSF